MWLLSGGGVFSAFPAPQQKMRFQCYIFSRISRTTFADSTKRTLIAKNTLHFAAKTVEWFLYFRKEIGTLHFIYLLKSLYEMRAYSGLAQW